MKALAQIITVFVALNLITAGSASTQPAPAPEPPETPQVEVAAQSLQEAQEQMKAAQKQMEETQKQTIAAQKQMKSTGRSIVLPTFLPHSDTGSILVIPTSEMKAEELAAIVEDMTVMARIIDKQLGKEQYKQMWGYGDFFGQGRVAQTMYLQGYGALFLRKVDFPLSPPPVVQEQDKETKKEGVDPIWEQTRRDMYEPQEDRGRREERPEEKYDAEKVENLKTNIIKALKHAANIRSLKPDESVVITITGSGDSSKAKRIVSFGGGFGVFGESGRVIVQNQDRRSTGIAIPTLPSDSGFSSTTTLIIRAKRADIDAFAKGEMDLEKFRQRVQIFTQ
ncbi:MAG: hypothetical protein MUP16_04695 [Sedimentisphaerales bacterium]|nr:hypothetical protein [Sedimentisphaerales bacterium]